jgi:hypothetical protein
LERIARTALEAQAWPGRCGFRTGSLALGLGTPSAVRMRAMALKPRPSVT